MVLPDSLLHGPLYMFPGTRLTRSHAASRHFDLSRWSEELPGTSGNQTGAQQNRKTIQIHVCLN